MFFGAKKAQNAIVIQHKSIYIYSLFLIIVVYHLLLVLCLIKRLALSLLGRGLLQIRSGEDHSLSSSTSPLLLFCAIIWNSILGLSVSM